MKNRCIAITKAGLRCPTGAMRGKKKCHVHHPDGKFQQQQKSKKATK